MDRFDAVYFVPTTTNAIALTYDDGPTPGVTDRILRFLEELGARATFFMVGSQVVNHPDLARAVVGAGHEVGIHSNHHRKGMSEWSVSDLVDDFSKAKQAILEATGVDTNLLRTPYGNISANIIQACCQLNLRFVGWSVNTKDFNGGLRQRTPSCCEACIPGSIVLMHDRHPKRRRRVGDALHFVKRVENTIKPTYDTVSSLIDRWDESATTSVDGLILLGSSKHSDTSGNTIISLMIPPKTLLDGTTCGVSFESDGKVFQSILPPLTSASNWCQPINIFGRGSQGFQLSVRKYNPETDGFRLNLGCSTYPLEGWENLDIVAKAPEVKVWQWGDKLPYVSGSAQTVLVQHSIAHCKPQDYDSNFEEIRRVLKPGGKVVVKDADNRYYVWHDIGRVDSDGVVRSLTNEPEMIEVLRRNGFINITNDKQLIVDRHGKVINRTSRFLRGRKLFGLEAEKPLV